MSLDSRGAKPVHNRVRTSLDALRYSGDIPKSCMRACGVEPWHLVFSTMLYSIDHSVNVDADARVQFTMSTTPSPPLEASIHTYYETFSYKTGDINVPDLVTFFTPGPSCRGRWLLPTAYEAFSQTTVYSVRQIPSGTAIDPLFLSCQPLSSASIYSPGACPDGYTMASIDDIHLTFNGNSIRYWGAPCCPR